MIVQVILSSMSYLTAKLVTHKNKIAADVAILTEVAWLSYIVYYGEYGFAILTLLLLEQWIRKYRSWKNG